MTLFAPNEPLKPCENPAKQNRKPRNIASLIAISYFHLDLSTYEATHDYDEYHFDLDEIEHDPYVLISILSALHEGVFTIDQVRKRGHS